MSDNLSQKPYKAKLILDDSSFLNNPTALVLGRICIALMRRLVKQWTGIIKNAEIIGLPLNEIDQDQGIILNWEPVGDQIKVWAEKK